MRIWGKTVILFAGLVAIASMAPAQQPFPFGGGAGQPDPVTLLRNPAVKKELNLTDEQLRGAPVSETGFYETGFVNRDWERRIHDYYRAIPYW